MKSFLPVLAILFGLFCLSAPALAQEAAPAEGQEPASAESQSGPGPTALLPPERAPAFTLETTPEDSPEMAKKKAALRLFKAYSVVSGQLNACKGQSSEAGKAVSGYGSRNGNTLSLIMSVIKKHGGITPDIRLALDDEIGASIKAGLNDCQGLARKVAKGELDLHKAPEYAEDYQLTKAKK